MKLHEVEDLRRKMNDDRIEQVNKENEIEALKEDIIRLQTELNKTEVRNSEMVKNIDQHKAHIQYLEKNKNEIEYKEKDHLLSEKKKTYKQHMSKC